LIFIADNNNILGIFHNYRRNPVAYVAEVLPFTFSEEKQYYPFFYFTYLTSAHGPCVNFGLRNAVSENKQVFSSLNPYFIVWQSRQNIYLNECSIWRKTYSLCIACIIQSEVIYQCSSLTLMQGTQRYNWFPITKYYHISYITFGLVWFEQQFFSYIVAVRFIGGGNRSTQGKPPICRKSLTNFIT
jgi:hypothetical protein